MKLGFDKNIFAEAIAKEISAPGRSAAISAQWLLSIYLERCTQEALAEILVKPPEIYFRDTESRRFVTLHGLAKTGLSVRYPEIRFSTKPEHALDDMEIEAAGFTLESMDYGVGTKGTHKFTAKASKTQVNHVLLLNNVVIPAEIFAGALKVIKASGSPSQPYLANPRPNDFERLDSFVGFRTVAFDHLLDGSRIFCSCARTAHEKMRESALREISGYSHNSWPHRLLRLLADGQYRDGLCHLCVAREYGPAEAAWCYGDNVHDFVDAYMDQLRVGLGLDVRTARAEVYQLLGLTRWKSEAQLFQLVKELLPGATVVREASPPWLGRQRLDIYVPELHLAIEYQGAQHFRPVTVFGGEDGLVRISERDATKKRLCGENGVTVLHVMHTHALTKRAMKQRLGRFIERISLGRHSDQACDATDAKTIGSPLTEGASTK